ncbi:MAG: helix-turn-helix domain-containing protein [Bacteroidales bacterium]|nr:helix-turn-helix domain-containing protein [Bacteroidales bacterium]
MCVKALAKNYFREDDCPVSLYRVSRKNNITHAHDLTEIEHFHDFMEIVFILKGQGIQVVENYEYHVSSGDVFVLQGNQKHYFKDASIVEIVNVMVDDIKNPHIIPEKIRKIEGFNALFILEPKYRTRHHFKNKLQLNRHEIAKIEILLNGMFLELNEKNKGFQVILVNRLQELLILLSRHYSLIEITEARSLVDIGKVLEYFENNLDKKIYIDDMADMANMSKRNFHRIFKCALGISPVNYLIEVRLQKARKLLRETDLQIADISIVTGFSDSTYFIKCFRQTFGTTPHKFKMRFQHQNIKDLRYFIL